MKKTLAANWLIILLVVIMLLVAVMIWGKKNKEKKQEEIRQINEVLDANIGMDGTDIKTLIQGISRATAFDAAPYAKAIKDAPGYMNDDEQAVYDALSGKTRGQVASIFDYFLSRNGKDLDIFLKGWMNGEEYETAVNIVKLSR